MCVYNAIWHKEVTILRSLTTALHFLLKMPCVLAAPSAHLAAHAAHKSASLPHPRRVAEDDGVGGDVRAALRTRV
jgi:hypothetical protein